VETVTAQGCPKCGTTVPVHHGYVSWCHECGWNLTAPQPPDQERTRFDRLYAAAGRRFGDRLASELLAADELEPRLTPTRVATYTVALLAHLLTLALAVGAIVLVALTFPNPAAIVAGLIMVGLAYLMRPRLGKVPDEGMLTREDAPALYKLADDVADALDVPHVDVIAIDGEFNASWAILGLRRRRVLTLGLPALAMLTPQERAALVAHELAHGRNGDSTRGVVVGSAVRALAELYWAVAPEDFGGAREWGEHALFERIVNVLLWVVSRPVLGVLVLEFHLLLHDSQRAEYLADALAARVAGTPAAVSLEEKMLLAATVRFAVQHTAHDRSGQTDLFAVLIDTIASVPERELERRRRVARLEDARLSSTHPPTAKRIQLLEERARLEPQVVCTREASAAIDAETAHLRKSVQSELVDTYRDSLYAL